VYEIRETNSPSGEAHFANIDQPYHYHGQHTKKFLRYFGLDIQEKHLLVMQ